MNGWRTGLRKDIIIIVRKITLKDPSVPTLPADAGVEMKESFEGGLGKQIRTVSGPLREKTFKRISALKASASAALSNRATPGGNGSILLNQIKYR